MESYSLKYHLLLLEVQGATIGRATLHKLLCHLTSLECHLALHGDEWRVLWVPVGSPWSGKVSVISGFSFFLSDYLVSSRIRNILLLFHVVCTLIMRNIHSSWVYIPRLRKKWQGSQLRNPYTCFSHKS